MMNVSVFMEAEDKNGTRISGGEIYYNPSGSRTKKLLSEAYHIPRIFLGCKYKDQVRLLGDREGKPVLDVPHLCIDLDSFTRVERLEKESGWGEKNF